MIIFPSVLFIFKKLVPQIRIERKYSYILYFVYRDCLEDSEVTGAKFVLFYFNNLRRKANSPG